MKAGVTMEIANLIVAILSLFVNILMLRKVDQILKASVQSGGTDNQNVIQSVKGTSNDSSINLSK